MKNRFTKKPFDNINTTLLQQIKLLKNNTLAKTYRVNPELFEKVESKAKSNNESISDIIKRNFLNYLNN